MRNTITVTTDVDIDLDDSIDDDCVLDLVEERGLQDRVLARDMRDHSVKDVMDRVCSALLAARAAGGKRY